jgi:hypothetical protein
MIGGGTGIRDNVTIGGKPGRRDVAVSTNIPAGETWG